MEYLGATCSKQEPAVGSQKGTECFSWTQRVRIPGIWTPRLRCFTLLCLSPDLPVSRLATFLVFIHPYCIESAAESKAARGTCWNCTSVQPVLWPNKLMHGLFLKKVKSYMTKIWPTQASECERIPTLSVGRTWWHEGFNVTVQGRGYPYFSAATSQQTHTLT